jgi:Concanavalin A-like lectin/glucanases superfamily/F5/8 type C domain
MFWKVIYSVAFVMMLGLIMSSSAVAGDPSLVLKLEFEGNANDSSGYGNDGTLMGDVGNAKIVTDSLRGQVLETDGSNGVLAAGNHGFVDCGNSKTLTVSTMAQNITVMCWVKSIGGFVQQHGAFVSKNGQTSGWQLRRRGSNNFATFTLRGTSGPDDPDGVTNIADDEWHHVAGTYDGATRRLYVDGNVDFSIDDTGDIAAAPNDGVAVGARWNGGAEKCTRGRFDDVRIYRRALTAEEIRQAMIGLPLGAASDPSPADEATDAPPDVLLGWTPGQFANTHDVYFGSVFADVNDASRANPGGLLASQGQTATTYDPSGRLDFGRTYYWRVDEVNAPPDSTIFKGDVWSFTVEPLAYPIDANSIAATASSSNNAGEGPENTINGSGLDANDLHSDDSKAMWLSSIAGPQPTWIQYEFDRVYKLNEMRVWNYNSSVEPVVGFGIKEATVEYSLDGANWTTLGTTHQFAQAPGAPGYASNTSIDLGGVAAKYVKITANSNWGGILNQYGLSEVRFFYIPVSAREPSPVSGATDVSVDEALSWRAGRDAAKHDVYLSTDEQAVIDGTAPVVTVSSPSYTAPLDLASTYYWRIDEVNEAETPTTWQGDVWNLSTQEYLVVDDFESYNDIETGKEGSNLVYETWIDGFGTTTNGSTIGYTEAFQPSMETSTVFDGKQSVPLFYNNTVAAYSEVTANVADLQAGQDWSKHSVEGLTLRFYGDPCNVSQQMYVKINGTKVPYDGDAANLSLKGWQMWYIDLASLGVDLSNVTTLSIGFERIGTVGGQGMVLLDGIRLYSYDRQLITPADPGTTGLQAWYQFEGNTADSSGNGRDGAVQGEPVPFFGPGKVGQAINLVGSNYLEATGYKGILQSPWTLACWINTTTAGDMDILSWGTETAGEKVEFRLQDGRLRVEHGNGNIIGDAVVNDGRWHHVVAVLPEGGVMKDVMLYLDGGLLAVYGIGNGGNPFITTEGVDFTIGRSGPRGDRYFTGMIDDVRLYDRVLSQEQIAWLAGRTQPFDKAF